MRPGLRFLDDALADRILDEARSVLATLGVELHDPEGSDLLATHGATVVRRREEGPDSGAPRRPRSRDGAARVRPVRRPRERHARPLRRERPLHARLGGDPRPGPGHPGASRARHRGLRQVREARRGASAPGGAEHGIRPVGRPARSVRQLSPLPRSPPLREAGRHRGVLRRGLPRDARPPARRPRHAGGAPRQAPRRLHLLPDLAPGVERGDGTQPPRLRTGRSPGRNRRGAARRIPLPGDADRDARPGGRREPERRRPPPARCAGCAAPLGDLRRRLRHPLGRRPRPGRSRRRC